jgi:small subunit ribosomal protein S14
LHFAKRIQLHHVVTMAALFRAKKLDLGCFVNNRIIRDHSKRKVFEENEVQR